MTRPDWDEYFMDIARAVAKRSEDPSSKVGCVIVSWNNEPISFGYNGFVAGCSNEGKSFERPMKYHLIIHAEMNALMFAKQKLNGTKLYCTHAPCDNCLKHILQSGIRYIIFDKTELLCRLSTDSLIASLRLIGSANFEPSEFQSIHDINGIWYGNMICDELEKRGIDTYELFKPTQP
jgi:dCMP deaminase